MYRSTILILVILSYSISVLSLNQQNFDSSVNLTISDATKPVIGADKNLYFLRNNKLYRRDSESSEIRHVAGNGEIGTSLDGFSATETPIKPFGYVADDEGNIYLAELANYELQIRKIDIRTNSIELWFHEPEITLYGLSNSDPRMEMDHLGNILVIDEYLYYINTENKSWEKIFFWGDEDLFHDIVPANVPLGGGVDDNGNIFVTDFLRIGKFSLDNRRHKPVAGCDQCGNEKLGTPALEFDIFMGGIEAEYVKVDGTGNIFLGTRNNIYYIDVGTGIIDFFTKGENLALDKSGYYWVQRGNDLVQIKAMPKKHVKGTIYSEKGNYRPVKWLQGALDFEFEITGIVNNKPFGKATISFKKGPMYFRKDKLKSVYFKDEKLILVGQGTINGQGNYNFRIDYINGYYEKVRLQITDAITSDVIYDSQYGEKPDAVPTTILTRHGTWFQKDGTPIITEIDQNDDLGKLIQVQGISVSPNPFNNNINISLPGSSANIEVAFSIFDIHGRKVKEGKLNTGDLNSVHIEGMTSGIHILNIHYPEYIKVFKLIKE